jgi:hypothetical protein
VRGVRAGAEELLEILHALDTRHTTVLLIGHNPGLEELAGRLVAGGPTTALARLREGFPTGALATSVDTAWTEPGSGDAKLDSFARPRDLSRQRFATGGQRGSAPGSGRPAFVLRCDRCRPPSSRCGHSANPECALPTRPVGPSSPTSAITNRSRRPRSDGVRRAHRTLRPWRPPQTYKCRAPAIPRDDDPAPRWKPPQIRSPDQIPMTASKEDTKAPAPSRQLQRTSHAGPRSRRSGPARRHGRRTEALPTGHARTWSAGRPPRTGRSNVEPLTGSPPGPTAHNAR